MKRRGVSEIISTIIIILIISIVGTLLFTYSLAIFQGQQDKAREDNILSAAQSQERFKLTAVWWNKNTNLLNISLLNYGTLDIQITDIYINGDQVQTYFFGRNEVIYSERYLRIAFTSPVPPVDGETYIIKLVTSKGVKINANWEA